MNPACCDLQMMPRPFDRDAIPLVRLGIARLESATTLLVQSFREINSVQAETMRTEDIVRKPIAVYFGIGMACPISIRKWRELTTLKFKPRRFLGAALGMGN